MVSWTMDLPTMKLHHKAYHMTSIVLKLFFSPLSWIVLVLSPLPVTHSVSYQVLPSYLDPPKNLSITAITPHRATIKWTITEQQGSEYSPRKLG